MSSSIKVNIFILCYNEEVLLPKTIEHYKKYLPNAHITIYDNESTDNSVKIAKNLGCDVILWKSDNAIDDYKYINIKNNCWKNIENGWIIMIDMDEWLCVSENDLYEEQLNGTTMLKIKGYDMIGESKNITCDDISLHEIIKYVPNNWESKLLCFNRENIIEINYSLGCHSATPKGNVKLSNKTYINKHMNWLGINFIVHKYQLRYLRSENMRKKGLCYHYDNNEENVKKEYEKKLHDSLVLN